MLFCGWLCCGNWCYGVNYEIGINYEIGRGKFFFIKLIESYGKRGWGIFYRCLECYLDWNSISSFFMFLDYFVRFERGIINKKILFYKGWGMFIKKFNFFFLIVEVFKMCWKLYYKLIVVFMVFMMYW